MLGGSWYLQTNYNCTYNCTHNPLRALKGHISTMNLQVEAVLNIAADGSCDDAGTSSHTLCFCAAFRVEGLGFQGPEFGVPEALNPKPYARNPQP